MILGLVQIYLYSIFFVLYVGRFMQAKYFCSHCHFGLILISGKIFEPFYFRIQQLGSTPFKGRRFGAKTSRSTLDGSTPLIFGSCILDPGRLSSCTIYTFCLLYEIHYLETRSHCVNTSFITLR